NPTQPNPTQPNPDKSLHLSVMAQFRMTPGPLDGKYYLCAVPRFFSGYLLMPDEFYIHCPFVSFSM
ncbi:hypothetical protein, partial [Serratia liquefaciens]|uniref:hypothetical protein n=3 Tax=Serratia liquefaciens TaxID=614 RepID=UPI003EC8C47B